jgi:hypothetical protein
MPDKNTDDEITFVNKLMQAQVGQKTLGGGCKHVEEMGVGWGG